jgi:hypothetical protein
VETASIHIVRVIQEAHRRDATAVEVSEEATDAWTERMRGVLADSLLTPGNCATSHTYYLDANGDAPFVRPTSAAEARRACRTFPLDDYRYERLTA